MAFAAPAAIADGGDLILIAGILVVIGLLMATKSFVQVLFIPFQIKIPVINVRPFGSVASVIEDRLVGWIDNMIKANQQALASLLSGLVWLTEQTANAIVDTADLTERAFNHIVDVAIPGQIESSTRAVKDTASAASASVASLDRRVFTEINSLTGKVTAAVNTAEAYADNKVRAAESHTLDTIAASAVAVKNDAMSAIGALDRSVTARIEKVSGTIDDKANAARNAAIAAIKPAIDSALHSVTTAGGVTNAEVRAAISDAIAGSLATGGTVASAIQSAVGSASHQVTSSGGDITDAIRSEVATSIAAAIAAGGSIDTDIQTAIRNAIATTGTLTGDVLGQLEGLVRPIEQEIQNVTGMSLPQLAATVAGLSATVALVTAESGLDNPSCRAKNKEICGVDSSAWSGLLGGLAGIGIALDFRQLVEAGRELIVDLTEAGDSLGIGP